MAFRCLTLLLMWERVLLPQGVPIGASTPKMHLLRQSGSLNGAYSSKLPEKRLGRPLSSEERSAGQVFLQGPLCLQDNEGLATAVHVR